MSPETSWQAGESAGKGINPCLKSAPRKKVHKNMESRHIGGAKSPSRPILSLTMIAKDEEKNLPRALESVRRWVDEIILVDTGSTDRTVQIAEKFKAKVYHHPWENDFAKHRNQALSYAAGDWVLILDADEELDQETAPLLAGLMAAKGIDAYQAELCNVFGEGKRNKAFQIRLFRNIPEIRYFQNVHNQITVPGKIARCGLRVMHYGYAGDPAAMEAKHRRREKMIRAWLEREPENWRPHYYMAQALLLSPGLVETAEGFGRRYNQEILSQAAVQARTALDLAEERTAKPEHLSMIHVPLVQSLALLGPEKEFLRNLEGWLKVDPENLDPYFFLVDHCYQKGDWPRLRQSAQRFCALHAKAAEYLSEHPQVELNTVGLKYAVLVAWLVAAAQQDQRAEALEVLQRILAEDKAEEVAKVAIERVRKQGLASMAQELVQEAMAAKPQWEWPVVDMAPPPAWAPQDPAAGPAWEWNEETAAPDGDLLDQARELSQDGNFELAVSAFDRAFAHNPPGPKELCELAFAHAGAQRPEAAEQCYLRALDLNAQEVGALFNLGVVQARQGKLTQAAESLERCLDLEPSLAPARELLQVIHKNQAHQDASAAGLG